MLNFIIRKLLIWNLLSGKVKNTIKRPISRKINNMIVVSTQRLIIATSDEDIEVYHNLVFKEFLAHPHHDNIQHLLLLNGIPFPSNNKVIIMTERIVMRKLQRECDNNILSINYYKFINNKIKKINL